MGLASRSSISKHFKSYLLFSISCFPSVFLSGLLNFRAHVSANASASVMGSHHILYTALFSTAFTVVATSCTLPAPATY